jgi:putative transposase
MRYNYRYRLNPTDELHERLAWTVDTCRQVYNHFLHRLNQEDGTSAYSEQSILPDLKREWTDLKKVHSKVLQKVVQRLYDNLSTLKGRKDNGYHVGELKWKAPQEYRSIKYSQTGFELNNTSGRTVLSLSKIGDIPMVYHRDVPDNATIKEVVVKQEPTGEWFAVLGIETENDPPSKPDTLENCVGIDVGILKCAHDTDGTAVECPDLSDERERLEREQRKLSRKEHGSANYRKQQRVVANRHADLKRKRRDFLHKLSNHYAREYDLVAVEDLDAKGLIELPSNSRNRTGAAWGTSSECSSTTATAKARTLWPSIQPGRPKSVRPAVSRRTNRCGSGTLLSLMRFHGRQGLERSLQHLGMRPEASRDGLSRINACGDCAPYGDRFGSCKARSPDVVWRAGRLGESANVVESGSLGA